MNFDEFKKRIIKEYQNYNTAKIPTDDELILQFFSLKVFSNWNIEENKKMMKRIYKPYVSTSIERGLRK